MSSRESSGYQAIIRGLLARSPRDAARIVNVELAGKPNAALGERDRSGNKESFHDEGGDAYAGSLDLDTLIQDKPRTISPAEATGLETAEDDRALLRPARGVVIAIILGVVIWGLAIGGILIEVTR